MTKIVCSFCGKEVVLHHIYKHMVHQHTLPLLDFLSSGCSEPHRNINQIKNKTGRETSLPCFSIPKGDDFYYCLGCDKGFKKAGYLASHPTSCRQDHILKCNELTKQYQDFKEGKTTESKGGSGSGTVDFKPMRGFIWNRVKAMYTNEVFEKEMNTMLEILVDKGYITDDQLDEVRSEARDKVEFPEDEDDKVRLTNLPFKQLGLDVYPFSKEYEILIEEFEPEENRQFWIDLIEPKKPAKKSEPVKKPKPDPPKPEPELPKPEPPKPEPPKPSPPPLASSYYQALRPAPVAPPLPSIIQTTKR